MLLIGALPFQGVLLIGALPFQGVLLIGALPFQGVLLIGVVDLYISFDKRFSEIPLSPIRPEGAETLRLWYAEEITLSPTRPVLL